MDFGELYELYFKDICRYVYSLAKNDSIAEEITQETFYKALKAIDSFDGAKDIRAWLFTIARNTYYSYCKSRKDIVSEDLAAHLQSDVNFIEQVMNQERSFLIHQFLHAMNEPYKEVFTLRVFGELSFEKIGALFGKTSGWARVTFYRAKVQIADYLKEVDNETN